MLNKILIAVFAALLIFIIIEAFYLFIYKKPSENKISQSVVQTNVPSPTLTEKDRINLNASRIDYWGDIMRTSTATNEFEGILVSVIDKPGVRLGIPYIWGIQVKSVNPANDNGSKAFIIRESDLPITKVYDESSGSKKEISFKELKTDDKVKITEVVDLLKEYSNNRTKVEIIKHD